jgi:hypothetical protein
MNNTLKILMLSAPLLLGACASKRAALVGPSVIASGSQPANTPTASEAATKASSTDLAFVQKVSDTKVYAQDIVASLSFNAKMGDKDITVPGSLHMRKNQVIRLQLFIPILGSEVGRLEFTPDYVLVVDRMHKEYMKGDYSQLDFLRDNGLDFYSLQALFWNQLLLPGTKTVGETDLMKYVVNNDGMGQNGKISYQKNNMSYTWTANRTNGQISQTDITYTSAQHGMSSLVWTYGKFKPVGSKAFPSLQEFVFTSKASGKQQKLDVTLDMDDIKTTSGWDAQTTVSDKYKQVNVKDVLGKMLNK